MSQKKRAVAFAAAKRNKAIAFAKSGGCNDGDLDQALLDAMNEMEEEEEEEEVEEVEDAADQKGFWWK